MTSQFELCDSFFSGASYILETQQYWNPFEESDDRQEDTRVSLPPPQSLLPRFLKRDARKLGTSAKRPAIPNRGGATGDEAASEPLTDRSSEPAAIYREQGLIARPMGCDLFTWPSYRRTHLGVNSIELTLYTTFETSALRIGRQRNFPCLCSPKTHNCLYNCIIVIHRSRIL